MSNRNEYSVLLDASGLDCPMPLLKTKLALHQLELGEVLKVIATDPGSGRDIPKYLARSQDALIKETQEDGLLCFWIEKGANNA